MLQINVSCSQKVRAVSLPLHRVVGVEIGDIGIQLQDLVLVVADGVLDLVPVSDVISDDILA